MEVAKIQVGQNLAGSYAENYAGITTPQKLTEDRTRQPEAQAEVNNEASQNFLALKNAQVNQPAVDKENNERQRQHVETAAREIEAFLQVQARNLSFSIDKETERSVVTVKDSDSGDVIRQIPSEEVLRLAERIKELQEDVGSSVGVLLNNRV